MDDEKEEKAPTSADEGHPAQRTPPRESKTINKGKAIEVLCIAQ